MKKRLNEESTPLQGELGSGILWSKDDAFAQVMSSKHCERVRRVGFGPTPLGRNGANISQYTITPLLSSKRT